MSEKLQVSFQSEEFITRDEIINAFKYANSISIVYSSDHCDSNQERPNLSLQELRFSKPGLKVVFYNNTDIIFIIPVKTGVSKSKFPHKASEEVLKLCGFMHKSFNLFVSDTRILIVET